MLAHILTIDRQRYRNALSNLNFMGMHAQPWIGDTPPQPVTQWEGPPLEGIERRVAIVKSYRRWLKSLEGDGPWMIMQDDVLFERKPEHDPDKPLTLYNRCIVHRMMKTWEGYKRTPKSKGIECDPFTSHHVCAGAFSITREAVEPLLDLLQEETDQVCVLWADYISERTTSLQPVARFR